MGREVRCHAELGDDTADVRALLESAELRLVGPIKAAIALQDMRQLRIADGVLEARTPRGRLRLHLGADEARKWLQRIESPPTLQQKLGITADTPVHVVASPPDIRNVLDEAGARHVALGDAQLVFIAVVTADDLQALEALATTLPDGAHLWVLRRKGRDASVKEGEIMALLRAHGFAPSKTAAWSDVYAADRYGHARNRR